MKIRYPYTLLVTLGCEQGEALVDGTMLYQVDSDIHLKTNEDW